MDEYIKKYGQFKKKIIYTFSLGAGGIGDCIKFFIFALTLCMKYNYKLYYQVHDIAIEKYLKLKYKQMYIRKEDIRNSRNIDRDQDVFEAIKNINEDIDYIVEPGTFYDVFNYDIITPSGKENETSLAFLSGLVADKKNLRDENRPEILSGRCNINIQDVFEFSDEVINNSRRLIPENIADYISMHLRLGDKYLETEKSYVACKDDVRSYDEYRIFDFIEENFKENIIFFCDNNNYKLNLKSIYSNIIITTSDIGHTSLLNTTEKQTLDTITEFYLLTNSKLICAASSSGFSSVAAKFKNIPLINI